MQSIVLGHATLAEQVQDLLNVISMLLTYVKAMLLCLPN